MCSILYKMQKKFTYTVDLIAFHENSENETEISWIFNRNFEQKMK